jgi:transposase
VAVTQRSSVRYRHWPFRCRSSPVARSILVIIWHLLKNPEARFTDLGHGYYQARTDKDKKIKNHIRQIEALLGHPVTITKAA